MQGRFPRGTGVGWAAMQRIWHVQPRLYPMGFKSCVALGQPEGLGVYLSFAISPPTPLTSLLLFPWWGQHLPIPPAHRTECQL